MTLDDFTALIAVRLGKSAGPRFRAHAWRFDEIGGGAKPCDLAESTAVAFARQEHPMRRAVLYPGDDFDAFFDSDSGDERFMAQGCTESEIEEVAELAKQHLGFTGLVRVSATGQSWNIYRSPSS